MSRGRQSKGLTNARIAPSVLAGLAVAMATGCGGTAGPASTGEPSAVVYEEPADPEVVKALLDGGVYDHMVIEVSNVGDANGFIVDTRGPTSFERYNFAYLSYLACMDVVEGENTWENIREKSISTGATEGEADTMISYWEDVFCPAISGIPRDDDPLADEQP